MYKSMIFKLDTGFYHIKSLQNVSPKVSRLFKSNIANRVPTRQVTNQIEPKRETYIPKDNYLRVAGRLVWAFDAAVSTILPNFCFLMPFR